MACNAKETAKFEGDVVRHAEELSTTNEGKYPEDKDIILENSGLKEELRGRLSSRDNNKINLSERAICDAAVYFIPAPNF